MSKSNIHKKLTKEDKFAREFYCENARKNQIKTDKKLQKKAFRKIEKKMEKEF